MVVLESLSIILGVGVCAMCIARGVILIQKRS